MDRRPQFLLTILGFALLAFAPLAAAQPDPRAAELLDAFDHASTGGNEFVPPRTGVMNLYSRTTTEHGPSTMLVGMAFDFEAERAYVRTCFEGELVIEMAFRDGRVRMLDAFTGEIMEEPAGSDEMAAILRQTFRDPTAWMRAGYDTARYDGPVDYGIVAGEQVSMEVEIPGQMPQRIAMLFGPEGELVAEVVETPEGRMVVMVDGLIRVGEGMMPRGMTMYLLREGGTEAIEPYGTMRFWRPRFDVELDESWFVLEPRPLPESTRGDRREEVMDRITEVYTRLAEEMDMPLEEQEALFAEGEALMAELETLPLPSFVGPACPGPL